jgi:hypothetical protein
VKFTKERLQFGAMACFGLLLIVAASQLSLLWKVHTKQLDLIKKMPLVATASLGHSEFGWTMVALEGLAKTINAWSMEDAQHIDPRKKDLTLKQFDQFYENIDSLATAQIGMREVFTYPASYLAFDRNDLENALRISELGAQDNRLTADLALVIAYLKHLFATDLNEVANAYERVLLAYPQATWLKKTIEQLREGVDPMLRTDKNQCRKLLFIFPRAKRRLTERGICSDSNKDSTHDFK